MKYTNVKSFEKHSGLSRLYLIAIPDDYERNRVLDAVLSRLPGGANRFSGADCNLRDVLDAMSSMSLLGESVTVLDEVEKMAKKEVQILSEHLQQVAGYALFGSRSKTPLLQAIEKEGIVLNLLEEKPWDKEKRLIDQLIERAKSSGKKLLPECGPLLLERLGTDAAVLESEIDKLICYVGEKNTIAQEDILKISPVSHSSTLWQTAEETIWEGKPFPSLDATAFHTLIPALRNQLHLGLTLSTLIEENRPSAEWGTYLPKLWPKTLEKRSSQAARLGSAYFRKGLQKLFDLELLSRSNSTQYQALLDLFYAHTR